MKAEEEYMREFRKEIDLLFSKISGKRKAGKLTDTYSLFRCLHHMKWRN